MSLRASELLTRGPLLVSRRITFGSSALQRRSFEGTGGEGMFEGLPVGWCAMECSRRGFCAVQVSTRAVWVCPGGRLFGHLPPCAAPPSRASGRGRRRPTRWACRRRTSPRVTSTAAATAAPRTHPRRPAVRGLPGPRRFAFGAAASKRAFGLVEPGRSCSTGAACGSDSTGFIRLRLLGDVRGLVMGFPIWSGAVLSGWLRSIARPRRRFARCRRTVNVASLRRGHGLLHDG